MSYSFAFDHFTAIHTLLFKARHISTALQAYSLLLAVLAVPRGNLGCYFVWSSSYIGEEREFGEIALARIGFFWFRRQSEIECRFNVRPSLSGA